MCLAEDLVASLKNSGIIVIRKLKKNSKGLEMECLSHSQAKFC